MINTKYFFLKFISIVYIIQNNNEKKKVKTIDYICILSLMYTIIHNCRIQYILYYNFKYILTIHIIHGIYYDMTIDCIIVIT